MLLTESLTLFLQVPGAPGVPLVADISWSPDSALEVKLAIKVDLEDPVTWIFGRNLLQAALDYPGDVHGRCDVKTQVQGDWLSITLSSPFGIATFRTLAPPIKHFLERAYAEVPAGEEVIDIDDAIAKILSC